MNLADHPPLHEYVSPARARLGWWRPVAGFGLIIVCWFLGVIGAVALYAAGVAVMAGDLQALPKALDVMVEGGDPVAILVILASFGGIWLGCLVVMRGIHALPFRTLFGRWYPGGFLRGLLLGLGFVALSMALTAALVGLPQRALGVADWAPFVLPIVALVFLQAVGEELIFRGYLLQQLAARFSSPWVWAVLPSFGFGLMHYNGELSDGGGLYYVAITTLTGLSLCVCVWRTGNLWAANGLHVGINLVGILFVGSEGILWGTQLWTFTEDQLGGIFQLDLVASLALLAFLISPLGGRVLPAPPSGESAEEQILR